MKSISKDIEKSIIETYNSGKGSNSIALEFNVHPNSVLKILKRNSIDIRPHLAKLSLEDIEKIKELYQLDEPIVKLAKSFSVSTNAIRKVLIKNRLLQGKEGGIDLFNTLYYGEIELSKKNILKMSFEEREKVSDYIFNFIRKNNNNFKFISNDEELHHSYTAIHNSTVKLNGDDLPSQSAVGTSICRFFCEDFYHTKVGNKKPSYYEAFHDDKCLKAVIRNRIGIDGKNNGEVFTISIAALIRGFSISSICANISIFKPTVAKVLYEEYTMPGDTIFDFSAGWGGRMLGATASGRGYVATDPLTTPSLERMKEYFKLPNVKLFKCGSEEKVLDDNTIDFAFSSPPYYDLEKYSNSKTQAYNKGEKYFYEEYWAKTLENIKNYVKPNKYIGINIIGLPRMLEMANNIFGNPIREIKMKMSVSHLSRGKDNANSKYEPIYIYKNIK